MPKVRSNKRTKKVRPQKRQASNKTSGSATNRLITALNKMVFPKRDNISGSIGRAAGNIFGKVMGFGAYSLKQNSLMTSTGDQVPHVHSNNESIVMRHREYIGDFSCTSAFSSQVYTINPGLPSSFPYLSSIASCFQEYEFKGLIYEFKSTAASALNSTNVALGTVMLAAQYRSDATAFQDKITMLNEMWAVDGKPCDNLMLPIECSPNENPLKVQYIRTGALPAGQDPKMYDLGKVTIASVGAQATAVCGELWVSYEVVLRKPQAQNDLTETLRASYTSSTALSATPFIGMTSVVDNIGLTFATNGVWCTLPAGSKGRWLFQFGATDPAAVAVTAFNVTFSNATGITTFIGSTGSFSEQYAFPANTQVSSRYCHLASFYVTNPTLPTTIQVSGAGVFNTAFCQVNVIEMSTII